MRTIPETEKWEAPSGWSEQKVLEKRGKRCYCKDTKGTTAHKGGLTNSKKIA